MREKFKALLVKVKPYWPWIVGGIAVLIVGMVWGWKLAGLLGGLGAVVIKGSADVVTPARKKVEALEDKQRSRREKADAIRKEVEK